MFGESEKGLVLPDMGLGEGTFQSEMRGWVLLVAGGIVLDQAFLGGAFTSWLLVKLSAFL